MTSIKFYQSFSAHLVQHSPWPILVSFSLFNLAIGTVLTMHGYSHSSKTFDLGLAVTVGSILLWTRDIVIEGSFLGDHTKQVQEGLIIGFILFIISEVFAFISVFWAYFHSALSPAVELGSTWPPVGIIPLDTFSLPLFNTIILLSSGAFVTYGHHAIFSGKRLDSIIGLFLTVALALIFTYFQAFEYIHAGFSMSDSVFGTVFFASTGLHGIHVMLGTLFLFVSFLRQVNYQTTKEHNIGLETSILYWHFVDLVWLFLFLVVYFWGGA